ncbi:dynamin family protein [Shimazuella kribbensis]|uniref:dynamin family protein n=1 Tax=Shimazuella kribbensis TaxID=139808 RepID=UPI000412F29A|nr:dynamin family protein [Shimazuella kribbensis]
MIQTSTNIWLNRLALLYEEINEDNPEIKNKCMDFMQKINRQELAIAFTGHFSAGKSSFMNHLFGFPLLPTSPIPTSANVVKVKHGQDKIQLRYFDGSIQEVVGTYTEEAFQALCRDGDRAIEVIIERNDIPLPSDVAIVDTPGVDSTDEAHRIATEANLHVSDVIFYMMDYNHVQAEGNLQFVKDLTDRGKQVYLIINQIDKHRDSELSFATFQQGVKSSFAAWNIDVAEVYYTSLKQVDHPNNQLLELKSLLHRLYEQKITLMEHNVEQEICYLIEHYIQKKRGAFQTPASLSNQEQNTKEKEIMLLQQQKISLEEKQQITTQLMKDLDDLLKNAYLMPANLREQAKSFLEAMQPDFKIGIWFAKNKTEQERSDREHRFFQSLMKTVSTQLTGHTEELVQQHAKKYGIFQSALADELHQNTPIITIDILRHTIKQGAGISGNYVLTYTNDLVENIKNLYRVYVRQYLTNHLPKLEEQIQHHIQHIEDELQTVQKQKHHIDQQQQELARIAKEHQKLLHIIQEKTNVVSSKVIEQLLEQEPNIQQTTLITENKVSTKPVEKKVLNSPSLEHSMDQKQTYLLQAEKIIEPMPELLPFLKQLQSKRKQMEQQQFTVALFGAFSAGKSSFANALLGNSLLPVSPNPTTATVCRICPPTAEHGHKMAAVTFKSKETLAAEIQHIFQLFHTEKQSTSLAELAELLKHIPKMISGKIETTRQKMALPFLRAIQNGFDSLEHLLGTTASMQYEEAISYMANEAKSAFVEEVSLYYDSILAKLGITLVDTPGADSLHARHTDVAFRYMKQADALLFVTYYNHAFSRADRELLIQLGRVQDSFALDKMYFIVNAADLASSDEELDKVVAYVQSQLNQYGIRHPRMYPVSSLASLEDKQQNRHLNPAFARFEQAFLRFIQEDSRTTTVERMIKDVEQAVNWINEMLIALHTSESEKEVQQQRWTSSKKQLIDQFGCISSSHDERNLAQEIKTLLYYVGERLRLRYNDEFPVYINPSTIRDSGKAGRKQLSTASKELLDFIGNDLVQEFRATSLRLEKWIDTALTIFTKEQTTQQNAYLYGLTLTSLDKIDLPEIAWKLPVWEEENPHFQKAIAIYKNNQSFFERNGRDQMKEQLKLHMDEVLLLQITHMTDAMAAHFTAAWKQNLEKAATSWIHQVSDHFDRLQSTLSGHIEEKPLMDTKIKLEKLLLLLPNK